MSVKSSRVLIAVVVLAGVAAGCSPGPGAGPPVGTATSGSPTPTIDAERIAANGAAFASAGLRAFAEGWLGLAENCMATNWEIMQEAVYCSWHDPDTPDVNTPFYMQATFGTVPDGDSAHRILVEDLRFCGLNQLDIPLLRGLARVTGELAGRIRWSCEYAILVSGLGSDRDGQSFDIMWTSADDRYLCDFQVFVPVDPPGFSVTQNMVDHAREVWPAHA